MVETMDYLDDNKISKLDEFWNYNTSYILNSFDCQEYSILLTNFTVCVITILLFIILCYFLLLIKIRK